jgi:hypothetical protein
MAIQRSDKQTHLPSRQARTVTSKRPASMASKNAQDEPTIDQTTAVPQASSPELDAISVASKQDEFD